VAVFTVDQLREGVNLTMVPGESSAGTSAGAFPNGAAAAASGAGGEALPYFLPEPPRGLSGDETEPGVVSIPGLAPSPQTARESSGEGRLAPGGTSAASKEEAGSGDYDPPAPIAIPGVGREAPRSPAETPQIGAGSFGRRYKPLENGKMADARLKSSTMGETEKLSKLSQIKKSAEEYEGMLIAEMIKSMRQSPFAKTPGSDTYSEIAERPFTAALTAAGGLGLSQTIITQVAAQEGLGETLAAHPEVMGPRFTQHLSPSQMTRGGLGPGRRERASADRTASTGQTGPIGQTMPVDGDPPETANP
jgi:Rod binding domain-containing protein